MTMNNAEYVVAEWIATTFNHTIPNTNPQTFGGNTMRLAESLLKRLADQGFSVAHIDGEMCS